MRVALRPVFASIPTNFSIRCLFLQTLALIALVCAIPSGPVYAQDDTGLCPENFTEGVVTTGYVDCFRVSSDSSSRETAEERRLEREAECIAEPRSELIFSEVLVNSSGNFFASLVCRINRVVPSGTVLCPDGSLEVVRAFDTLACEFYGSASNTQPGASSALNADRTACNSAPGGSVLVSSIMLGSSQDDDEPFFFTDLSCGFEIPATDIFECPAGFDELDRDENMLECRRIDADLLSESAGNRVNAEVSAMCSSSTAGLGSVVFSLVTMDTSGESTFASVVDCDIKLPRFGEFKDAAIVRACDATCTEDIEQTRSCLNGGQIGGPGCTAASTQIVTERCNTGIDRNGLCPLSGVPTTTVIPLLLIEDDED